MKKKPLWLRSFLSIWSSKTCRIMRNSILIMLISATSLFASDGYSQSARVSMDLQNTQVKDVLAEIERTSEFFFLYSNKLIDVDRKVNIHADNSKISEILDGLFQESGVKYVVIDRQIILTPGEHMAGLKEKSSLRCNRHRRLATERLRLPATTYLPMSKSSLDAI